MPPPVALFESVAWWYGRDNADRGIAAASASLYEVAVEKS
jgi:hypothetical protein